MPTRGWERWRAPCRLSCCSLNLTCNTQIEDEPLLLWVLLLLVAVDLEEEELVSLVGHELRVVDDQVA